MINCAFIGMGLIGQKRLDAVEKLKLDISFIVDPDINPKDSVYKKYGVFKNINEVPLSLKNSISHVFLAVPHFLVKNYLKEISSGMNILIEKPLGLNFSEAKEIEKIVKEKNFKISSGFNYRHYSHIQELKKFIAGGHLENIMSVNFSLSHGGRPGMEKEWKLTKSKAGGGVIIDPGVHLFDLMFYLFDPNIEIVNTNIRSMFWENCDVEDYALLILEDKEKNIIFNFELNLFSWQNNFEIKVHGKSNEVLLSGRGGNYGDFSFKSTPKWFWLNQDSVPEDKNFGNKDESFMQETKEFCLKPELLINSNLRDGIKVMELVENIYSKL